MCLSVFKVHNANFVETKLIWHKIWPIYCSGQGGFTTLSIKFRLNKYIISDEYAINNKQARDTYINFIFL